MTSNKKQLIITIISVLLTTIVIIGAVVAVKFWLKFNETKEQKDDKSEDKNQKEINNKNSQTYTYQDLEDLKNDFNDAYYEGDLNNFKNPTTEFKKLQEEFVEKFKTNFIAFENQFQQIDQNNSTQINELYREYELIVRECYEESENLKKQYQPEKTYQDLKKLRNDFVNSININNNDSENFVIELQRELHQEDSSNQIKKNIINPNYNNQVQHFVNYTIFNQLTKTKTIIGFNIIISIISFFNNLKVNTLFCVLSIVVLVLNIILWCLPPLSFLFIVLHIMSFVIVFSEFFYIVYLFLKGTISIYLILREYL